MLPSKCTNCMCIVPASVVASGREANSYLNQVFVTCPHCNCEFLTSQQTMRGDPRNQAIVIHEDGWNPQTTSAKHSIAAITISHATMRKALRADGKTARVYSFIPTDQLPQGSPHKVDAFFYPLLLEIEDLFMNGLEVFFAKSVEDYPCNDFTTLRLVPLLLTADMKAHAEVGLVSSSGYKGCRRCEATAEYHANHCRFGNFQYRYRFPVPPRNAETNRMHGKAADNAITVSERKLLTKQTGVTGETILFRLFDLCGFDPVKDQVIDVMHCICLNLIRNELDHQMLKTMNDSVSLPHLERDPQTGGILCRKDLADRIDRVQWTTEMKEGRIPYVSVSTPCGNSSLGYWKAEEYSKFSLVAPYVLRDLICHKAYDCFLLLTEIRNLLFSYDLRIKGWHRKHIELLKNLLWKHAILFEETYGLQACTDNLEYSLHIVEDISRHSCPDNYWCYVFERLVSFHKDQTTNQKQICKTLSNRIHQLRFIEDYLSSCQQNDHISECFLSYVSSEEPLRIHASTIQEAMQLKDFLSAHLALPRNTQWQYDNGIPVGSSKPIALTHTQRQDVAFWLSTLTNTEISIHNVPEGALSFNKLLKSNEVHKAVVYRVGEVLAIEEYSDEALEWVVEITHIFSLGPFNGAFFTFINGNYFKAKTRRGELQRDEWTNQSLLVPQSYSQLCIQPAFLIKRKLILYSYPHTQPVPQFYLAINVEPIVDVDQLVEVPIYPCVGEIVRARGSSGQIFTLKVSKINKPVVVGYVLWQVDVFIWKIQQRTMHVPLTSVIEHVSFELTNDESHFILHTS